MRYNELISTIGAKVQEARKDMSQKKLVSAMRDRCDGSAFNRNKLSALENCANPEKTEVEKKYDMADLSVRSLCALSDLLNVDLLYLFGRQDYKKLEHADICKYTGLSESAISSLHEWNDIPVKGAGPFPPGYGQQLLDVYSSFISSALILGALNLCIGNLEYIKDMTDEELEDEFPHFASVEQARSFYIFQLQTAITDFLLQHFKLK